MLQSMLEALELDDCSLVFRRCPSRLFQCFGDLSYQVCYEKQLVVSGTVTRVGPLTDPTDEIPNGEAKGRSHPGAEISIRLLSVDEGVDMFAEVRLTIVKAAMSLCRASHLQPY